MSADTTFSTLGVPTALTTILSDAGITVPTPIQAATLPDSMAGRDVLGRGRTGSGKTYAFLLPLLTRLSQSGTRRQPKRPRALILAPTRELVTQIVGAMTPLAKPLGITSMTVFGGVGQNPQVEALRRGVDVVVACPGRLEDLMKQGHISLDAVEITILDEADHMADLGFLPGVRRIMDKTPQQGQRMLFSATLDAGVDVLVKRFLHNPVTHHADSEQSPVIPMSHHVLHVSLDAHLPVLVDLAAAPGRTIIFARTKHRAKKFTRQLNASGVPAVELHGNLSQGARTRNLDDFHSGAAKTMVATDIAARGIHVDDVALVIHADPPVEHKAYLHRSGRTARAGAAGTVITLMTDEQVRDVRDLTRKAGINPTTTKIDAKHPLLQKLAPGERSFVNGGLVREVPAAAPAGRGGGRSRGPRKPAGQDGGRANPATGGRSGGAPRSDRPAEGARGDGRPRRNRGGSGQGAGRGDGAAARGGSGRSGGSGSARDGSGSGRSGGSGRSAGGSKTVYSSTSGGGAAAFSARTRVGSR
ncbi:DEAD/DEAH box helicase [Nakamurella lactea]|uniref:DEAD/DEAH box helicase n=1 Tax=Nakamurella lactea TaxID=459515 RepID=UPI0004075659|nr:DEAD/DEAH box helicase [Nakamurella lactea]